MTNVSLRKGSNMELRLLRRDEVMDAMALSTTAWTSSCERRSRIMALATTCTSGEGAQWWYSWAVAITTEALRDCSSGLALLRGDVMNGVAQRSHFISDITTLRKWTCYIYDLSQCFGEFPKTNFDPTCTSLSNSRWSESIFGLAAAAFFLAASAPSSSSSSDSSELE